MTTRRVETAQQHRLVAERAEAETLWEDAVREYEAALSLVAQGEGKGEDETALLTRLGACYWNLADARTAWRTLRRAIALARERVDAVGMARATVEITRIWGPPDRLRSMADEALAALGDADPHLRAFLLLRRSRYNDPDDPGFAEALSIIDQHQFEDFLMIRTDRAGWEAIRAGRFAEGAAGLRAVHETYARLRLYEPAAGVLRGAGFNLLACGELEQGEAFASQAYDYACSVHMRFQEQLALLDLVGLAFARCEFARARKLIAQSPGQQDFRGDLYHVWMMELRGDIDSAVQHVINPERGGGAPTAISQTHGGNAGVLFHAGRLEGARRELAAWMGVARQQPSFCEELPAVVDCLVALGTQDELLEVQKELERDAAQPAPMRYCTLQGRALDPARGAVAAKLGRLDQAERAYRNGLAWCQRERLPIDAGLCHAGLADLARSRGDDATAAGHRQQAAALFEANGARLWLDRLT
jgi:tetratricopeptide (TPR) repeat protein